MDQNHLPAMTPDEPARSDAAAGRQAVGRSWIIRSALLFAGVLLPVVCFALGFPDDFPGPSWRSGRLDAYAGILLWHVPSMPLYPFLLYSMVSMGLVVLRPGRFDKNNFVRFGIFSGVLVAAEYWVIFQVATSDLLDLLDLFPSPDFALGCLLSVVAALVPIGILWLAIVLVRKLRHGMLWVRIAAAVFLAIITLSGIWLLLVLSFWCATSWAIGAYAFVSARLIWAARPPRFRFSLAQLFAVTTWFAAHCGAWRASYLLMLHEYARLPAASPGFAGCFVCSAAARGHPRLVGSQAYVAPDGTVYRVNDQLRRLKAFELLLASVSPAGHRALRRRYDRVGPRVAAWLASPLAADAAYCALKPVEWLARLCLRLALPGQTGLVGELYRA